MTAINLTYSFITLRIPPTWRRGRFYAQFIDVSVTSCRCIAFQIDRTEWWIWCCTPPGT